MYLRIPTYKKFLEHFNVVFICTNMQEVAARLCKNGFTILRILKKMRLVVLTEEKVSGINPFSLT